MIDALRGFLDLLAGAKVEPATSLALAADIERWSADLAAHQVPERDQIFAHRLDLAGRGQTMAPALHVVEGDERSVVGTVTFGRYFLGGNGAAHGGTLPLLFDELLGRLANTGERPPARTAYLHVNYRSITPIGVELQATARFESESGRKRVLRGELRNGDILCADAEGLFVELLPGQP
ncbi:MAG: PaaI family thioesterase [Ilumatobacteraceae bacterium]